MSEGLKNWLTLAAVWGLLAFIAVHFNLDLSGVCHLNGCGPQ